MLAWEDRYQAQRPSCHILETGREELSNSRPPERAGWLPSCLCSACTLEIGEALKLYRRYVARTGAEGPPAFTRSYCAIQMCILLWAPSLSKISEVSISLTGSSRCCARNRCLEYALTPQVHSLHSERASTRNLKLEVMRSCNCKLCCMHPMDPIC